jgi:hypothetical protein
MLNTDIYMQSELQLQAPLIGRLTAYRYMQAPPF